MKKNITRGKQLVSGIVSVCLIAALIPDKRVTASGNGDGDPCYQKTSHLGYTKACACYKGTDGLNDCKAGVHMMDHYHCSPGASSGFLNCCETKQNIGYTFPCDRDLNWSSFAGCVGLGASVGATLGSFFPGLGTMIGGALGALSAELACLSLCSWNTQICKKDLTNKTYFKDEMVSSATEQCPTS